MTEILDSYDANNDGSLSRAELETLVSDELSEDAPQSFIEGPMMTTLRTWTGATRLQSIYNTYSSGFNKAAWVNTVKGKSNLVFVCQTTARAVLGGYIGSVQIPTTPSATWLSSPDMFIFNLKTNTKWTSAYSSSNIWVNTQSSYADLIDFGWHNALQFEQNGRSAKVTYAKSNDFLADPTAAQVGVSSANIYQFEIFQMFFD